MLYSEEIQKISHLNQIKLDCLVFKAEELSLDSRLIKLGDRELVLSLDEKISLTGHQG